MRVTSELWVSALVKRIFSDGGFAAIRQRGAKEAGAIFILRRTRLGDIELYGPAPQTSYDEAKPSDRQFAHVLTTDNEYDIEKRLKSEMRFDPDIWVVEIEPSGDISGYFTFAIE